ncbi:MAG: LamG domain-containing protein [Planctomycetes bacterium]|nr:LamG domain-containing protein [Planctomycetota bacterium]
MIARRGFAFVILVAFAAGTGTAAGAEIEVAGELFVDLDAGDPSAGDDIWENQGTLADFSIIGTPVPVEINGAAAILFEGGSPPDAYQCLEIAPEGLIGVDPTRSIEVWAFNDAIADEETLLSWGKREGPDCGTNMSFNYGANVYYGAVGHWCHLPGPDIGWGLVPVAGEWHHLAYTYDGTTTRVYADGIETNFEVLGAGAINTHGGTPITIAAQLLGDGTIETTLAGTLAIGRVRIHDEVLTPEQIRSNHDLERPEFPCVNCIEPAFADAPASDTYVAGETTYRRVLALEGFPPPAVEVVGPAGGEILPGYIFSYDVSAQPASFEVTLRATSSEGTAQASWTVTRVGCVPGKICTAGELFVYLDAADPSAGTDFWENKGTVDTDQGNLGTLDGFDRIGDPIVVTIGKAKAVQFNRGATLDAYRCADATPGGLVGLNPTRSIEAWVFNPAIADEETILSWSHRGGPAGTNMSFNYGLNAAFGAIGHWDWPDIGWGTVPSAGTWHYLVYTFDGTTTRVYVDGVETANEVVGAGVLNTYAAPLITIAAQIESDGVTLNTTFRGTLSIGRVRIHDGALSPSQISHNFALEEADYPCAPPLFLDAPAVDFVKSGASAYTRTLAVQSEAAFTLSVVEPAGATITPEGLFTYVLPVPEPVAFTVTIEAKVPDCDASLATWPVEVVAPPPTPEPVHRYTFDGDATDCVGDADGTIYGNVTFQDGKAILNNDALPNSNATGVSPPAEAPGAYIDLPNGIISALGANATFETWTTWDGPDGSAWQRIFDFGTSNAGENSSAGADATYYVFLTPWSGTATLRFGYNSPTPTRVERVVDTLSLTTGVEHHIVIVWEGDVTTVRMYLDGVMVAEDLAVHFSLIDVPDLNNWLGRSQWADAMYDGSYNEFRIYDYALSEEQVRGDYVLGPDEPPCGPPTERFIRGDTDGSGVFTIGDGIQILERLFTNRTAFSSNCEKTGDYDDTGALTIGDAVSLFNFLFVQGSRPPQPPYPDCGADPTPDDLPCVEIPTACR